MRKIIGIGETILDIIFKNNQPSSATPGGSVFNGMITLGRLGQEVCFISDVGCDHIGNLITDFMEKNHLSSKYVYRHPAAKTAVALAFLNENSDADYTFFKDYSYEGLQGEFPEIHADDIVVFGSYYALNPLLRKRMKIFLQQAQEAGAILYYDINFRKSHSYEVDSLKTVLQENFNFADILRGSEDDFMALYHLSEADQALQKINEEASTPPSCFIYTAGAKEVSLRSNSVRKNFSITPITPLSTVGAGDTFNAGIVFALMKMNIRRQELRSLSEEKWNQIVGYALAFSAEVCQSFDNYISDEFALRYR